MDRFKRKIGLGFLAGLCLLGSIFGVGITSGGAPLPASSEQQIENNYEIGESGDLVSISSVNGENVVTIEDRVFNYATKSEHDAAMTEIWSSVSTAAANDSITVVFDGCYFSLGNTVDGGDGWTLGNTNLGSDDTIMFKDCYFTPGQAYSRLLDPRFDSNEAFLEFHNVIFRGYKDCDRFGNDVFGNSVYFQDCLVCEFGDNGYATILDTDNGAKWFGSSDFLYGYNLNLFHDDEYWTGPWNFEDKWAYVVMNTQVGVGEVTDGSETVLYPVPICYAETL